MDKGEAMTLTFQKFGTNMHSCTHLVNYLYQLSVHKPIVSIKPSSDAFSHTKALESKVDLAVVHGQPRIII